MTKKTLAWAIKNPDGYIPPDNVSLIRRKAISMRIGYATDWKAWDDLRKHGYRCIRVEIKSVQPKKKVRRG